MLASDICIMEILGSDDLVVAEDSQIRVLRGRQPQTLQPLTLWQHGAEWRTITLCSVVVRTLKPLPVFAFVSTGAPRACGPLSLAQVFRTGALLLQILTLTENGTLRVTVFVRLGHSLCRNHHKSHRISESVRVFLPGLSKTQSLFHFLSETTHLLTYQDSHTLLIIMHTTVTAGTNQFVATSTITQGFTTGDFYLKGQPAAAADAEA